VLFIELQIQWCSKRKYNFRLAVGDISLPSVVRAKGIPLGIRQAMSVIGGLGKMGGASRRPFYPTNYPFVSVTSTENAERLPD
jgi:hypothetical protein